jgi:hypothetical protein
MLLPPELVELRRSRPVLFAAFDAMGKRGAVEIEYLWPAVESLRVQSATPAPDPLTLAALVSAARIWTPDIGPAKTLVLKWLAAAPGGFFDVGVVTPPHLREYFEEIRAAGEAAAIEALNAQEPA